MTKDQEKECQESYDWFNKHLFGQSNVLCRDSFFIAFEAGVKNDRSRAERDKESKTIMGLFIKVDKLQAERDLYRDALEEIAKHKFRQGIIHSMQSHEALEAGRRLREV